ALATLYLQSGSPDLAAREFARAGTAAPGDSLVAWGAALAALARGKGDASVFEAFAHNADAPESIRALAPNLALYARLMRGDADAVRRELVSVTPNEPDPLRLEIAAFAALRGGEPGRGEELLSALMKRPGMDKLAEDPAVELTFDPDRPAVGEATGLP